MKLVLIFIGVFVATLGSPLPQAEQWPIFGKQIGARISNVIKGDDSWEGFSKAMRSLSQTMQISPEQILKIVDVIKDSQPPSPESSSPSLPNMPQPEFKFPSMPMTADIENKVD